MIAFFISRPTRLLYRAILLLDAVGLSLFCVVGAQKALDFGLMAAPAIILGAAIAVATVRDELLGVPGAVLAASVCFAIRMIGVRFKLNAPVPPSLGKGEPPDAA